MQDYGKLFFTTSQEQMQEVVTRYIPQNFNWLLFSAGEALVLFGVWDVTKKLKKE
jgi:hypothetical protein